MVTRLVRRNKDKKDVRPEEKIISGGDFHRRNSCKTSNLIGLNMKSQGNMW
jgi:hypothetical protein